MALHGLSSAYSTAGSLKRINYDRAVTSPLYTLLSAVHAAALHVAQTQLSGYNAAILTATHVQRRLFTHVISVDCAAL